MDGQNVQMPGPQVGHTPNHLERIVVFAQPSPHGKPTDKNQSPNQLAKPTLITSPMGSTHLNH